MDFGHVDLKDLFSSLHSLLSSVGLSPRSPAALRRRTLHRMQHEGLMPWPQWSSLATWKALMRNWCVARHLTAASTKGLTALFESSQIQGVKPRILGDTLPSGVWRPSQVFLTGLNYGASLWPERASPARKVAFLETRLHEAELHYCPCEDRSVFLIPYCSAPSAPVLPLNKAAVDASATCAMQYRTGRWYYSFTRKCGPFLKLLVQGPPNLSNQVDEGSKKLKMPVSSCSFQVQSWSNQLEAREGSVLMSTITHCNDW